MGESVLQRSFSSGELTPGLAARADLVTYLTGLRRCRNFQVLRQGGIANRAGFMFVAATKTIERTFLFPFVFAAANESYIIEAGDGYFRFFHNGAPLLVSGVGAWSAATPYVLGDLVVSAGVNYYCVLAHLAQAPPNALYWYALTGAVYEIPTPYGAGAFQDPSPACFAQSGFRITITHLGHVPRELRYSREVTGVRWTLVDFVTKPAIDPPANPLGVAGAAGARTFAYVITAVAAETYEESSPSEVVTIPLALQPTPDAPHVLTWDPRAGAVEYTVYADPFENGTFGFIGVATGVERFNDIGEEPDFTRTPPVPRSLFASAHNYPAVSVVHQQRQFFGGTENDREDVFASQVGKRTNFSVRSPLQDDDALTWNLASNRIQPVMHLISLKQLIMLTDSGEWVASGNSDGVLLPTAINLDQHGYVGSAYLTPIVIGNAIVFVQARGTVLRDLAFDEQQQGLSGRDLTPMAGHLFRGYTLVDLAYAQVPDSTVWCVRSDGVLLGLTYVKEDGVWGWHRHDTDGVFEQVCVIPEGAADAVYVIVARQVGGHTVRYVERLAPREFLDDVDACFLDASVRYTGTATRQVSGLTHLEGLTVRASAAGAAVPGSFVVTNGRITLPAPQASVVVGLPITAEAETVDLDVAGSNIRDKRKRVAAVAFLVDRSARGFFAGPDAQHLYPQRAELWEAPTGMVSGRVEMALTAAFGDGGRVFVRHTDPTALSILAVIPNVDMGG